MYEPPEVFPCESIMHADSPAHADSGLWNPAVVSRVGSDTLACITWEHKHSSIAFRPKDGVRHIGDPQLKDPVVVSRMAEDGDCGVWDYSPQAKVMRELKQRVEDLEESVAHDGVIRVAMADELASIRQMTACPPKQEKKPRGRPKNKTKD